MFSIAACTFIRDIVSQTSSKTINKYDHSLLLRMLDEYAILVPLLKFTDIRLG